MNTNKDFERNAKLTSKYCFLAKFSLGQKRIFPKLLNSSPNIQRESISNSAIRNKSNYFVTVNLSKKVVFHALFKLYKYHKNLIWTKLKNPDNPYKRQLSLNAF